jgi:hypothetical protein
MLVWPVKDLDLDSELQIPGLLPSPTSATANAILIPATRSYLTHHNNYSERNHDRDKRIRSNG